MSPSISFFTPNTPPATVPKKGIALETRPGPFVATIFAMIGPKGILFATVPATFATFFVLFNKDFTAGLVVVTGLPSTPSPITLLVAFFKTSPV